MIQELAEHFIDQEFHEFLCNLEFELTRHYNSARDWRCSFCVENATECLFGDPGCPYRQ